MILAALALLSNVPAGPAEVTETPTEVTPAIVPVAPVVVVPAETPAPVVEVVAPPVESGPTCWPTVKAYLDAWHYTGVEPVDPCFIAPEPNNQEQPEGVRRSYNGVSF